VVVNAKVGVLSSAPLEDVDVNVIGFEPVVVSAYDTVEDCVNVKFELFAM